MALSRVPFGCRVDDKQQAEALGVPEAVGAVGPANGCNPASFIMPYERVISPAGLLKTFTGGLKQKSSCLNMNEPIQQASFNW
jgi:O-6-methylguanine DNA methyltransferase